MTKATFDDDADVGKTVKHPPRAEAYFHSNTRYGGSGEGSLQQPCERRPASPPSPEPATHPPSAEAASGRTGKAFDPRALDSPRVSDRDLDDGGSRGGKGCTERLANILVRSDVPCAGRDRERLDIKSPAVDAVGTPVVTQLL